MFWLWPCPYLNVNLNDLRVTPGFCTTPGGNPLGHVTLMMSWESLGNPTKSKMAATVYNHPLDGWAQKGGDLNLLDLEVGSLTVTWWLGLLVVSLAVN